MKVIAESAFNHNGNLDYLKKLSLEAKISGADYFTVQVMETKSFCDMKYEKYQLYKENEFSQEEWISFFEFAQKNEIEVIPCVLDEPSFKFCREYGFNLIKLHSTDITNIPFLELISKTDVKIILETQCATSLEIDLAVKIIERNIEALFSGFSNYPTEVEELNLNLLDGFLSKYNFKVGYADHSIDTSTIPCMILAKGADYIEKHITLTRNNRNFDYQVSLYPDEFSVMISNIKYFRKALGSNTKHPTKSEKYYRSIIYKKVLDDSQHQLRSDRGYTFIEDLINKMNISNSVAAVIARLKSKRLPLKVLKPFHTKELILDLFSRLSLQNNFKPVLATSNLPDDDKLAKLFQKNSLPIYRGNPVSVIDRLLELAIEKNAGSIFRVTGDNPFTDPYLMSEMLKLMVENDLDYVRVNKAPFGIGAELFSTKYLWKLYLKLMTTEFSEYLTWYVLNDDSVKAGSIELSEDFSLINLSIDYLKDYNNCIDLINKINIKTFPEIKLKDILDNLEDLKPLDDKIDIKLPEGERINLKEFINKLQNMKYVVKKVYKI